jgi:hypothetical protein
VIESKRQLRTELVEALRKLGPELDQAHEPAMMRKLIRRQRDLTLKLETMGGRDD